MIFATILSEAGLFTEDSDDTSIDYSVNDDLSVNYTISTSVEDPPISYRIASYKSGEFVVEEKSDSFNISGTFTDPSAEAGDFITYRISVQSGEHSISISEFRVEYPE